MLRSKRYRWFFLVLIIATGLAYFWWKRPVLVETGITLEKAAKLKPGMSYEEVIKTIGCKPGTYNEHLKNTNPPNREGKGREFVVEDADISIADKVNYEHVSWRDFQGIQIKVMFTKDTRQVHRVDMYRYVPEENAFRYAEPDK